MIHVDPQRAAQGPLRATVAHGYLTVSLVPRLLQGLLKITGQVRGTDYSIERVRSPSVVPVGAQLQIHSDRPALVGALCYLKCDS